jgi:hypothetical protein
MYPTSQLPDHNEVQIVLPSSSNVLVYKFTEVVDIIVNKKTHTQKTIKEVKLCFSGMENDVWRYQILCVNLDIEAKHIGSTTILRKQINVFDEVIVHVNQNGTIINLLNWKELKERWEEVKEHLRDNHQGSVLEEFLADGDKMINDKKNALKYISSRGMYGLYFNSLWGYHDRTKPRFEGLTLVLDQPNRVLYDRHTLHLQKPYNHDVKLFFNNENGNKTQNSNFEYKNNQLVEAFLAIDEPNINSKYSLLCLTK